MPAHAQTRYAAGLEQMSMLGSPATFGEVAKNEWERALREWVLFGSHEFPAHNDPKTKIRLDDSSDPDRLMKLTDNARYWTERWADQMNYRYWKDRAQTEKTTEGVQARQLFYEGTIAYKSADFQKAAQKFKEGLTIWSKLLEQHPTYRDDDFNKKDTGLIVQRYVRVLRQLSEQLPEDMPFKEMANRTTEDTNVDPFDVIEMMGLAGMSGSRGGAPTAAPAPNPR